MEKKITQSLKRKIWSNRSYYAHAAACRISDHPALIKIAKLAEKAKSILEVGCGEGSKLVQIVPKESQGFGVDISDIAVKLAKKKYPNFKFTVGDITRLPFKGNKFDLTFSAFVLEHLENPEKAILEQIRVTRSGGKLAFIAPNFGSPNRASPCFVGSRLEKLVQGFLRDLFYLMFKPKNLNWLKVQPRLSEPYQIDFDTQVEPYLLTLKIFLEQKKLKILETDSFWQMELAGTKFVQEVFRFLGEKLKIHPFFYWGPHLFLIGEKK